VERKFYKFLVSVKNAIKHNEVKGVKFDEDEETVNFTIRGRKHKVNADSITLWRKTSGEDVEVAIPIGKKNASELYEAVKNRTQSKKVKKINKRNKEEGK
jgi:hypothetical protein